MKILDANIIIRYILNDNEAMAEKAARLISEGDIVVVPEVISEVIYVLSGQYYKIDRETIKEALIVFLDEANFNNRTLRMGLDVYAKTKLDFVDCMLYSYHKVNGYEVCTFDKALIKLLSN